MIHTDVRKIFVDLELALIVFILFIGSVLYYYLPDNQNKNINLFLNEITGTKFRNSGLDRSQTLI